MSDIYRMIGPDSSSYVLQDIEDFTHLYFMLGDRLLETPAVNYGTWQSRDISGSDLHSTHELRNVMIQIPVVAENNDDLAKILYADLPWVENHFQERVGGLPINPGVEWANWPYHTGQQDLHRTAEGGKFDHNYMERYWPKFANTHHPLPHRGVRFNYGDLDDVVQQLRKDRYTRQAYLPIFFPEDTGATSGQRVPCSLGYHFMIRPDWKNRDVLFLSYTLRSCDIFRHFRNDLYMTLRLGEWVTARLTDSVRATVLTTTISSLHLFKGDVHRFEEVRERMSDGPSDS